MPTVYGYARCSTDESRQDIDRQKRELYEAGVQEEKNIYWEYESGTHADRIELQKLLDIVKAGDTIATTEVSRLTRSTKQLIEILQFVQDNRLRLLIGTFMVDCRLEEIDPMTKGMLMMWGVFAEMERDINSQRIRSGMKNAAAKGKKLGRPKITYGDIPAAFWKKYPLFQNGTLTVIELSRILKCSRTTIYKYIAIAKNGE